MSSVPLPDLKPKTLPGKIMRAMLIALVVVFLLGLLLTLAIQIPAVQNYVKTRTEKYLAKQLESEVKIDEVSIEWLSRMGISHLLIKDKAGDTSLFAGHVAVSMDMNLIEIFRKHYIINNILLEQIHFTNRNVSDSTTSIAYIFKKLFPPKPNNVTSSGKGLEIDLKNINLTDVSYTDYTKDLPAVYALHQAEIQVNYLDLENKKFSLEKIILDKPLCKISKGSGKSSGSTFNLFSDTTLYIEVGHVRIHDGSLYFNGWSKDHFLSSFENGSDALALNIDFIQLNKGALTAKINDIHALGDGFGIESFRVDSLFINKNRISLPNYILQTPKSILKENLQFNFKSFSAFKTFEDSVNILSSFEDTKISLQELSLMIPSLSRSDFIKRYAQEEILLHGTATGTVNAIKGKDLSVSLGSKFIYNGNLDVDDITKGDAIFLSLRAASLKTHAMVLTDIIPDLNKLSNFKKLGQFNYRGNFDGSPKDFVAYGILNSDLGYSKVDVHINTKNGVENATYKGSVDLIDFDLKRFTDHADFGTITLSAKISDGKGMKANTASAKLETLIKKFEYKGYDYANVQFTGDLNKRLLDGILKSEDPNARIDFIGKIDFTKEIPEYDFISTIKKLDLYKLNISKKPFDISGNLDFKLKGKKLDDMEGALNLKQITIYQDTVITRLPNLQAVQSGKNGLKKLKINSDWVDGELSGVYSLPHFIPSLKHQIANQFPELTSSLNLGPAKNGDSVFTQKYDFTLNVKDVTALRNLAGVDIKANPFHIEGSVDDKKRYFLVSWSVPNLQLKDLHLLNSVGRAEAKGGFAYTSTRIDSTFSKAFNMPYMVLTADMSRNKANFSITTPKVTNLVNNIDLQGTIELLDSTYHMKFSSSNVSFLDRTWKILPDNQIAFRRGYIQTRNLSFANNTEKISISSVGTNGIQVEVTNLDIDFINKLKPLPQWNLDGKVNLRANIDDLFSFKGLKVAGIIDSLYINNSYFGLLDFNAYTPNKNQPIQISTAILDQNRQLLGQGFYDIAGNFSNGIKNNYQMKFIFKDYPLRLFEYLIDDIIDNTKGNIQGNFEIKKSPNGTDFNGAIRIKEGGFKVNYLNTSYTIGEQEVKITNSMIDATGVKIIDELGNQATITGGLPHRRFKNFSVNASLTSPRLLVLKTTKEQNIDYYGTLIGNVFAKFEGPFEAINFDIRGTTTRGSSLNIPITQATVTTGDRVVQYRPKKAEVKNSTSSQRILASKGISVDIDMTITQDAEVALIFDEKRGDILKGTGRGNMQMKFDRTGDITMYGNYEVIQGDYLFTLFGVINKPFEIKPGGTIQWDGDPLGANIDLNADYKGLTSSLANLLPEFTGTIQDDEIRSQVGVDLSMHLYGELFKPDIEFNLDVPNLTGNLRSIVDNKLNILKSDQNALNQQVLSLIVWGSFLPPSEYLANSGGAAVNNLSQFIGSQLSLYVESALRELVADNNVISNIDFDVNYYNNKNVVNASRASVVDEWMINFGPKFFDDKLSIGLGANFVNSNVYNRLITPHFEVEYALTEDRRIKVRAYARKDDLNQGQLKDRIGGGISWRKEFDSAADFRKKLKDDLDKNRLQEKKPLAQ